MAALTGTRNTPKLGDGDTLTGVLKLPMAASTLIYKGALVAISAGYAVNATATTGLIIVGRAEYQVDNSTGAAGAALIEVRRGAFGWGNDGTITQANVGALCYANDNQTVSMTATSKSVAGQILSVGEGSWGITDSLVYVETTGRISA